LIEAKAFGEFIRIYSLTHSLTHSLMELRPSWEAANCAATQEIIPAFYRTRRFITVFTRALHWSLSNSYHPTLSL
jgi:hypothetical protein